MPSTFKLESQPVEQVADLDRWAWKLGQFGAARGSKPYPLRFIVTKQPCDLQVPIQRVLARYRELHRLAVSATPLLAAIDALLAGLEGDPRAALAALSSAQQDELRDLFRAVPALQAQLTSPPPVPSANAEDARGWAAIADELAGQLWSHDWQAQVIRFYEHLQARQLWQIDHYVQTWEPRDLLPEAIALQLQQTIGRPVTQVPSLPPIIACRYRAHATYLEPETPGQPFLAVLVSCEMRGDLDPTTLHPLLGTAGVRSIVLDIDTLPRGKAKAQMELAYKAARLVTRDATLLDTRAEEVEAQTRQILHDLNQQALHLVRVAVLVEAPTRQALAQTLEQVTGVTGTDLKLIRVGGAQDELLRLWSPRPTRSLDLPRTEWPVLSFGLGCLWGLLGYHQASSTAGILWAIDALRRAPLFFDLFQGKQAAHCSIVGMTGYGKSYFLNTVTLRAALAGWKVISLDIAENCFRMERAVGIACRSNLMGMHQGVNLLDVVYPRDAAGGWLPLQVQHVHDQLALLLGAPSTSSGDLVVLPRRWTTAERGILDQVLTTLYQGVEPDAPLDQMPLLSALIAGLRAWHDPLYPELTVGAELAQELHLFLAGSQGQTFNRPTTLDWDFSAPVNFFDFKEDRVPKAQRGFFMGQVIGAIYRYMLDPHRDRTQPTLLIVDEAGILGQIESVARMLAELAKRARKDALGVVVADQNPSLFRDNPWFKIVFELSPMQVLFRLKAGPAQEMAEMIHELTPEHVEFLTGADKGQTVMVVRNDVYFANIETSPHEHAVFGDS